MTWVLKSKDKILSDLWDALSEMEKARVNTYSEFLGVGKPEAAAAINTCTHEYVNVGFNTINMCCKYCGGDK